MRGVKTVDAKSDWIADKAAREDQSKRLKCGVRFFAAIIGRSPCPERSP